ncbi:MAG: acyl-CoA thioesterase [Bacteroidales bacterium]|nr:acyl-CoA thioesterase [Bacteroidales bacterium]
MHTLPIQIRFNDIDQMGHVNNAVIMEYFDLGKSVFFTAAGVPPEQGDFTVVIVHYEVDFMTQIHFRDAIEVRTGVRRFGTKSFAVDQYVVNQKTGQVCARCQTVMSGYQRSTGRSATIPPDLKQRLGAEEFAAPVRPEIPIG